MKALMKMAFWGGCAGALLTFGVLHSSAGESLSFDQALDRIVERSTAVGTQRSNLESLKATNLPTRLVYIPTLSTQIQGSATENNVNPGRQTSRLAQLESGLNLFRFGADFKANQAASADEERQAAVVNDTVLQVEEQGVRALSDSISRRQELIVQKRNLESNERSLKIANERYERGLLPLQEVQKVSVDLDNSKARLVERENSMIEAEASLQSLLGSDAPAVSSEWPWKAWLASLKTDQFFAEHPLKLTDRPDYLSAIKQIETQDDLASSAYRKMLPSVDALFTYVHTSGASGLSATSWEGRLVVSLAIFDRFSVLSNARSRASLREAAEYGRVQIERDAKSSYEASRQILQAAIRSATEREKTLLISRKLYEDNLRRFQSGRISSNDLTIDQERLFASEFLAIQAWSSAHLALQRFCRSVGARIRDCKKE